LRLRHDDAARYIGHLDDVGTRGLCGEQSQRHRGA
jgi:hypothetical protein